MSAISPTEPASQLLLEALDLCQQFGDQRILNGLSFQVMPGEALCLLGHNGVGKTTALNHFLGFLRPLSGQVRVAGMDPLTQPSEVRAAVGYVPENASLYPHLDALENIDYFLAAAGLPRPELSAVQASLQSVGFPLASAQLRAGGYSKGMRQKVVLALALVKGARVLLLDEPTTGLDPQSAEELATRISELKAKGVAILAVTHDLLWAQQVADYLGIMHGGRLEELLGNADLQPHQLADRLFSIARTPVNTDAVARP
ncbi:MAG: ABC transporter ATP-binding protein [Pseudomonas sp.]